MKKKHQVHGNINTTQITARKNFKQIAAYVACAFLFVGVLYYVGRAIAAEPQTTQTISSSCGARVANYSYKVPFSKNSPWNVPACNLAQHPQSSDYASRFYNWASKITDPNSAYAQKTRGRLTMGFGFEALPSNFSKTVYYSKDATTTIKVQTTASETNLDGAKSGERTSVPNNPIPWNPKWETSRGGDNEMIILDEATGRMYELWGVRKDPVEAVGLCGPFLRDRLCALSVRVSRDVNGNYADYRTFEGTTQSRGVGIPNYATLTTPEEVAAGEIRHALGVSIYATAFGPDCTKAQIGTTAEMKTCGTAVAPASKFEWSSANSVSTRGATPGDKVLDALYSMDKTLPEGMRFALRIDDSYIENWINSRADLKSNPKKANTARIFARALRDYGLIITDTNGATSQIQIAGTVNPDAKKKWADLGIVEKSDDDLLLGLITQSNIYTVETPTNQCADGTTSKNYCLWIKSLYKNQPTTTNPTPTPTPTPVPQDPPTPTPTPRPPEPEPVITPPEPVTPPTKPTVKADLRVGFWPEKFEFKYAMMLEFGGSASPRGIKEYIITRNGREIARTQKTNYQDFWVGNGGRYRYGIKALDTKGNLSTETTVTKAVSCTWVFCSAN